MINIIFDFLLLLGGIGGLMLGLRRGFVRMILATLALVLAVAFASLVATPLVSVFVQQSGSQAETPIGLVFAALSVVFYTLLEALLRHSFPETRIYSIGQLDYVLGFLAAAPWTLTVLALVALLLGYFNFAVTGASGLGFIGGWYTSSGLVAFLQDFFMIPLSLMSILYPAGLPQPLAFFAAS